MFINQNVHCELRNISYMLYVFFSLIVSAVTGYISPLCFLSFGLFLAVDDTNNFHFDMIASNLEISTSIEYDTYICNVQACNACGKRFGN